MTYEDRSGIDFHEVTIKAKVAKKGFAAVKEAIWLWLFGGSRTILLSNIVVSIYTTMGEDGHPYICRVAAREEENVSND